MSDIKTCCRSRWGNDGVIIVGDFKQLEVFGLQHLSGDLQLYQDIVVDKVDMHCLNASFIYDQPYDYIFEAYEAGDSGWSYKRKTAKAPGFLIQYGGGAAEMAAQSGLSVAACKKFIKNYYARYVRVKEWQDENIALVAKSRRPGPNKTIKGYPAGIGQLESPTGRIYRFEEQDSPEFLRTDTSFKPTMIKNYPVQGFATGDIVPETCGKMLRRINERIHLRKLLKMINTVHDSQDFDSHKKVVYESLCLIKETLELAPLWMKERFDIDINLPLNIDIEMGPSWGETEKVKFIKNKPCI